MNTLKKNRAKIIMLRGVLAAIMTGCSTPKQYYSDKVVDDYITWKIPGCELVDIEASDKEDTKNIYTYEDKYGREFYVENIVEYAQDLSGKDIKWMHKLNRNNGTYDILMFLGDDLLVLSFENFNN